MRGSMNEYVGRRPVAASSWNWSIVRKFVFQYCWRWAAWMNPVNEMSCDSSKYTAQDRPASCRRLKIVGALLRAGSSHLPKPCAPLFTTNPLEVEAWKNDRLAYVCDGTAACQ